MPSEVAAHYARALLDAASAEEDGERNLDRLADALDELADALEATPELARRLTSPAEPRRRRAELAQAVGDRLAPGTRLGRFAAVMVGRERGAQLGETAAAFRSALDARRGIVDAEVISARPLGERDRASLETALAAVLEGSPRLRYDEDPELLGGFVIRVGNRIYDASVSRQLARFEAQHGG